MNPVDHEKPSNSLMQWLGQRNAWLFSFAQACWWVANAARRNAASSILLVAIAGGSALIPFLSNGLWPHRAAFWISAALTGLVILASALIAIVSEMLRRSEAAHQTALNAVKHFSVKQADKNNQLLKHFKSQLEASRVDVETRLNALSGDLDELSGQTAQSGRCLSDHELRAATLQSEISKISHSLADADARLQSAITSAGQQINENNSQVSRLLDTARSDIAQIGVTLAAIGPGHETRMQGLGASVDARFDSVLSALDELQQSQANDRAKFSEQLHEATDALAKQIGEVVNRSVSLDLVSALRPLWLAHRAGDAAAHAQVRTIEHGHGLLMSLLADEERTTPGSLAGRRLIEIGTTRERMLTQGSTAKLAIFTGLTGMHFVTVDMDPINTKRANSILRFLNPAASAVTQKGEDYLAQNLQPSDFVYLDAFDFDHANHSELRRSRYTEVLNTTINDQACWKMHEDAAAAIAGKMAIGGIVVLDDTWTHDDGSYAGKGKLALPLFERSGFKIISWVGTSVALKRTAINHIAKAV